MSLQFDSLAKSIGNLERSIKTAIGLMTRMKIYRKRFAPELFNTLR